MRRMRRRRQRYFFMHIMKTGGISLLWRLRRVFPEEAIYPDSSDGDTLSDGPQISVPRLLERWSDPRRREQIRLVAGHLPYCTVELLDERFRSFTVLRDPVDRTLSFLSHHRANRPESVDVRLEALYEDPFITDHLVRNHMTKMLGMGTAEMTDGMMTALDLDDGHLQLAQRRLESFEVVGFTDRMEDFCRSLSQRYGWDLGDPIVSNRSEPAVADAAFRSRIAADNALDMALYEQARARFPTAV